MGLVQRSLPPYALAALTIALGWFYGPQASALIWQKFHLEALSLLMLAAPIGFAALWLTAKIIRQTYLASYFRIMTIISALPLTLWLLLGLLRIR